MTIDLLPPGAPPAFHLRAKPTGAICNLDCTYCFFLSKEMLYPGSRIGMTDDLLELYVRQLIEAHARCPEIVVTWQGAEPTMMVLDFSKRSVEIARSLVRPGQRLLYTIQTNGTPVDDASGVLQGARLPGRPVDRRPSRDPRHLPPGQRGEGELRPRDGGPGRSDATTSNWNALTTVHVANQDRGREVYRFRIREHLETLPRRLRRRREHPHRLASR